LDQRPSGGNTRVGAHAIDGKIVSIGTLTVDTELTLFVVVGFCRNHAWRERDQRLEAPAVERHVFDELTIDHGRHCRRLIDQRTVDDAHRLPD
jgi:hypothetical protein